MHKYFLYGEIRRNTVYIYKYIYTVFLLISPNLKIIYIYIYHISYQFIKILIIL